MKNTSSPTIAPPTGVFLRTQVRWDPALLEAPVHEAVEAWKRSLHGYAKRLPPEQAAQFLMALDSACYFMHGESAVRANGGLHPKHDLIGYHRFFAQRIAPGERVIDLGSGVGALAATLVREKRVQLTGIEWSAKNLAKATQRAESEGLSPRPTYLLGDITQLRAPGVFDTVILSNVLEHIENRAQQLKTWNSWYAPKQFLIRVPALERDWRVAWKKKLGVEWRCDPTHETEHTREQLADELSLAGLRIEELQGAWGEYLVLARPIEPAGTPREHA